MEIHSLSPEQKLISGKTPEEIYQKLIKVGQEQAGKNLPEELEQYLVRLLLVSGYMPEDESRHQPEKTLTQIFARVLGSNSAIEKGMTLHELGFAGLKLLGFFPGHIKKRHLTMSFVYDMTQSAYYELSQIDLSRVRSSSSLQAFVPLSKKTSAHLSDIVHVLWNTRKDNKLRMEYWPQLGNLQS